MSRRVGFTPSSRIGGAQGTPMQVMRKTQGMQGMQGMQGTRGMRDVSMPAPMQGMQGMQGAQGMQGMQGAHGMPVASSSCSHNTAEMGMPAMSSRKMERLMSGMQSRSRNMYTLPQSRLSSKIMQNVHDAAEDSCLAMHINTKQYRAPNNNLIAVNHRPTCDTPKTSRQLDRDATVAKNRKRIMQEEERRCSQTSAFQMPKSRFSSAGHM